jgi:hypothetical protein
VQKRRQDVLGMDKHRGRRKSTEERASNKTKYSHGGLTEFMIRVLNGVRIKLVSLVVLGILGRVGGR